jgi:hypothetical protein
MAEVLNRISFDEFSDNLARIFDRILSEGAEIVVEKGVGELVALKPVTRARARRRSVTKADDEAFLSAAGGWADVNIDAFLKDIYESRRSSRPPVEL